MDKSSPKWGDEVYIPDMLLMNLVIRVETTVSFFELNEPSKSSYDIDTGYSVFYFIFCPLSLS